MLYDEFLAFVGPAALEIEKARGYPAEALLAQVHLESGGLSAYPAGSFNVLGIKWAGQGEYVEASTTEYDAQGNPYTVVAKWQKYASIYDCLTKWADLMDAPWYAQAQPYKDNWAAFLGLIWYNGHETIYATNPYYQWLAIKRACDVGVPAWCANARREMQEPEVTVYLDDVLLPDTYRLVNNSISGKLRWSLDRMKKRGYTFVYDPHLRILRVNRGDS